MTVGEWLDSRKPAPPTELADRIRTLLGASLARDISSASPLLIDAAAALLRDMLRAGITARAHALDLLAVDALVTYAFEMAAESPDALPAHAEQAMLRIGALGTGYA